MTSRRQFLQTAAAGAATLLRDSIFAGPDESSRSLKLLILGGTSFLGRHIVEEALARGHSMTLFNRGKTNPHIFPELEKLRGDRDPRIGSGLEALEGRKWDAAIDTSGYVPRIVSASATLLQDSIDLYLFVSTLSVYRDFSRVGVVETDPVGTLEDVTTEDFGPAFENYGPLKALCEGAAEGAMPGRVTNVRPGLIVGPYDNMPRFTYWPARIDEGGEVLAPGRPSDPVQYIDARDLAAFCIRAIERRVIGTFNTNGPVAPTNIAELLYGCKAVTSAGAQFTWVNADFLAKNGVRSWVDVPVWIPPTGAHRGFHRIDSSRAIEAGLRTRPLADTARDTLGWFHDVLEGNTTRFMAGLTRKKEQEVLAAWHAFREDDRDG